VDPVATKAPSLENCTSRIIEVLPVRVFNTVQVALSYNTTLPVDCATASTAPSVGMEDSFYYQNDGGPQAWQAGMEQAINGGYDGVALVCGIDPNALTPQMEQAREMGISVVDMHLADVSVPADPLIAGQTMALPIRLAMRSKDVGDLEAGPDGRSRRRVRPYAMHGALRAGRTSVDRDAIERALGLGDMLGADVGVARRAPD